MMHAGCTGPSGRQPWGLPRRGSPEGVFEMCRAGKPKTPEVRASGAECVGAAPRRTVGESSPTSESLSDRLSKKIMSSYERLRSASGARLRSSSDRLQSRMGSTNSLALEVRASSQTQVSRVFVRPAQKGSSPSWHLTPAWRGVGVCRAHEDEKSSRSVVRSQSAVPCVGRASARDPHTKDTVDGGDREQWSRLP